MGLYPILRQFLFRLDAEQASKRVFTAVQAASRLPGVTAGVRVAFSYRNPALEQVLWGLKFPNPVGLAAGFDKDGRLLVPLAALGFGFLELGTVTPRPQQGNPQPRLFRLPEDGAVINRMGFNNAGADTLANRLATAQPLSIPVGVNVGKNRETCLRRATEDYVMALLKVIEVADFLTINISSPNTPGLRDLQARNRLEALLRACLAARDAQSELDGHLVPVFLKLSPDLAPVALLEVIEVARLLGVDGIVATNTTVSREGLRSPNRCEPGGLSGAPLFSRTLATVYTIAEALGDARERIPLVAVGGISNPSQAYAVIRAGASLVQLYTGLIYQGPGLVKRINRGLVRCLARDGFAGISDAVGADFRLSPQSGRAHPHS